MIKVLIGNLFESKAQTLVNTVNCVGVMGKGIALEFKKRFPEMFKDYVERCKKGEVKLGKPYLYKQYPGPWILNFPTKNHWRSVTNLNDIIRGLEYLLKHYKEWGITSIAVPPLGCGHGQLEWRVVGPTLYKYLKKMDIPVELYAPYDTPHEELQPEFLEQQNLFYKNNQNIPQPEFIKPSWVAMVEVLKRIEDQPYHWPVGRTTFQKIAYVLTELGIPTGLTYQKSSFGPFAPELKSVITRLLNNGLIREERLGRMFHVKVGPTFRDARKAYAEDLKKWEDIISKTVDLFMRVNTKMAEIIATVLFAYRTIKEVNNKRPSEKDILDEVMKWKLKRRPPLNEQDIAITIRNLAALGWLNVTASKELPLPEEEIIDV